MLDFRAYYNCDYIDEIYEYSNDSFEMESIGRMGFISGVLLSIALFAVNLPFRLKEDTKDEIGIIRNGLHKKVIKRVAGDLFFLNDDVKNKSFDIYRIGSQFDRLKFVFSVFPKMCSQDRREIKKILSEIEYLNDDKRRKLERFFNSRIAHTCYFKWAIDTFIKEIKPKKVIVSYTHDRFALSTERICKDNSIELVCIPHGEIENAQLPRRYPGDKVYLLNEKIVELFNKAYCTDAYIYDYEVLKKIYRLENNKYAGGHIVYFMTPFFNVDEQVDCIQKISSYLSECGEKLYVKQHPVQRYDCITGPNIEEIDSLEEAISGNMCIGFFTTALIDAVFNDSKTISILKLVGNESLLKKHKDVFEGCGITVIESEKELCNCIDEYLKGKN